MSGKLTCCNGFQEYWGYLYHLDAMLSHQRKQREKPNPMKRKDSRKE